MATNLEKLRERVYGAANPTAEQVQTVRKRASTLSPDAPAWAKPESQGPSPALPTVTEQGGEQISRRKAGRPAAAGKLQRNESEAYSPGKSVASAVLRGFNQIAQFGGDTLALAEDAVLAPFELFSGQDLGDLSDNAPFNTWARGIREEGQAVEEAYRSNRERGGRVAAALEDLGAATIASAPQAVIALLTGGGSAAAQTAAGLSREAARAVSPTVAKTVTEAVDTMARNPNYWTSFVQTVGGSYEEALEDLRHEEALKAFDAKLYGREYTPPENENQMRAKAALYALGNGLMNAAVEISGGVQVLPDRLRNGSSAWKAWVNSALDEGGEEVVQGVISRALQNLAYDAKNPLYPRFPLDEGAVFDPGMALEEFAGGAIVGGILGGGQIGAVRGMNALADLMRVSEARQEEAGRRTQGTQDPPAQVPQRGQEPARAAGVGTGTPTAQAAPTGTENAAPGAEAAAAETGRRNLLRESGLEAGAAEADIRAAEEISRATGREIRFYDGGTRRDVSGRANGYFDGETIYINSRSANPTAQIIAHEMTHSVELADAYQDLSSLVFDRIRRTGGDLERLRAEKRDLYARMGGELRTQELVDQEIVAEYVEHNLLTNEREILDLTRENPGLGRRILNWIDRVLARLGSSSAQERAFLTQARDTYARALEETRGILKSRAEARRTLSDAREGIAAGTLGNEEFNEAMDAVMEQESSGAVSMIRRPSEANRDTERQRPASPELRQLRDDYEAGRISDEEFNEAFDAVMEEEGLEGYSALDRYSFDRESPEPDLELQDRANRLILQGVDADTIRELTGLERTEDGSWRATVDTTPAAGYDGGKRAALTAGEETALLNYKSSDSYKLNAALRDGDVLDQEQYRTAKALDTALERLPVYPGRVYRRLSFDLGGREALDAFLRAHQVGELLIYPAYTSTSISPEGYPIEGDLTVTIVIDGQNGRNLEGFGNNFESEIVFPRNSKFLVERRGTDAQGKPVIYMREVLRNGAGAQQRGIGGDAERNYRAQQRLSAEERGQTVQQMPEEKPDEAVYLRGISGLDTGRDADRRLPGLRGERAGGAEVEPGLPDNPLAVLMGEDPQVRYSIDEQAEENPLEAAARGTVQTEESAYDALPRKARNYLDRVERRLLNKVGESLSVPRTARRDYLQEITREISEEYLRDGRVSQETLDSLFDRAYEEGVVADRDYYDEYQDLRRFLHDAKIQISPEDANDIPDFNDFRRSNFGRLNISTKSGRTNVDQIFQELSNRWPEFFNEEQVSAPSDQLKRIAEVAESFRIAERTLDEYYGDRAAEFRKYAKNDFEAAVTEMLGELRNVRRYAEGRAAAEQGQAPTTLEEVNALWATLKEARRTYERTAARNLLTDHDETQVGRLLRGETELQYLDPETDNVRGITEVYQAKQEYERISRLLRQWNQSRKAGLRAQAEQLLETANDWKDKKSGFLYARETMERNIRDIVPDAQLADQIIDTYFTPVHRAAADANRLKNRFREQVRAMDLSRKVADGNIVSEAHAVQLLGEAEDNIRMLQQSRGRRKIRDGKTLEEWQAVVNDLWAENPNLDQGKIRDAVKQFRAIYDQLFQQMNDARVRNGYEPVNYRQGYFPHFQPGEGDGILAAFGRALGVGTEVTALPTTINGMTHAFRPGIRWFGNAQERLGFNTAYDAVEGFDRYIEGVADVIYQTDNIQRLRALATEIRYRTGDEGIRKQIDRVREDPTLDDEDKQNRIDKIVQEGRFALNNFVVDLDEYTNLLANKKSRADRDMEQRLGRGAYNVARALESRVAANMVAINPASWLTNFIPLTQGSALLDRGMILRGMWETLQSYKNGDGIVDRSTFLTNRRGSDPLVQIYEQGAVPDSQLGRAARNVGIAAGRAGDVLSRPMEWIDNFTADSLVRARYRQNLKQGMSEDAAMADADAFAASVMADRSKGATPTMFSRTNPISKLFTQFQLEVNNQLSYVFKDLPREKKELGVRALAAALLKFALGAWLYDEAYEYLIGRRPALDPIGILNDTVGDLTGWEIPNLVELGVGAATGEAPSWQTEQQGLYDTLATLGTATAEELPFIGGLLGGGRLPIGSAIPDLATLARAATDDEWAPEKRIEEAADELKNPLAYLVTPFGGGQLKRIFETMNAVRKGGVYTLDAEGNEQLQYPVYNDTWQQAVANGLFGSVFGTTALGTGRDWVESGFDTLGADQTAAYQGMVDIGVPGEDAYELIQSLQGLKDPEKRQALRDADISGEGKSVVYYGLLASDAEMETMDALTDLGADMGEVTRVLMEIKDERQREGEKRTALEILAGSDLTADQKAEIYRSTASDSKEEKISLAEEYGVSGGDWVEAEEALAREQEEQDADGMTQAIAEGAIRTMEGLTREERAALWQLQNKGWSWQKNPFDRQTGREIYERTHAEDTEG